MVLMLAALSGDVELTRRLLDPAFTTLPKESVEIWLATSEQRAGQDSTPISFRDMQLVAVYFNQPKNCTSNAKVSATSR